MKPVKRRLTWKDVTPNPDNPIYPRRLQSMRRTWGGYVHELVGSPVVVLNDNGAFPDLPEGAMVLLDGHHRRALAAEDKMLKREFLGDLHRGLTRPEAFRLKRGSDDRRTIKPAEEFLQRCEEGFRKDNAIKDAVEGLGWHISYERANHGLPCVNELTWIWDQDRGAMTRAIQTYEAVWGTKAERAQARVIKGLGAFWIKYPDADFDRLVKSMEGQAVEEVYRSGKAMNDDTTFIKTVFDGVRYSLAMTYNKGHRKGLLPV